MNTMEPLRDPEVIENLADYFLQSSSRTEWIREKPCILYDWYIYGP